ncbi:hypothetical protein O7599_06330 [Streptomyces sp. WMMC500]|uniref:hypothetical protein n=1 Tax=Streptomyces sp. WMMC500 TaxID=3015154 RepID=UPI00248B9AC1|nr:hypothetical protein [Streptomyces sp. WMMC500]WBB62146.1 hypothetical protein O7599_06330 [Streptomyces sp. WMMC500]
MAEQALPPEMAELARFLRQITGWLDEETGWYGVFRRGDPDGLRACLDGSVLPPWDVVGSLLHDLAEHGDRRAAGAALPRARDLHRAAVAAYDARRPDRAALTAVLRARLTEHRAAEDGAERLRARLAVEPDPWTAQQLEDELAWVRDDATRASARCAELRGRIEALDRQAAGREPAAPPPAALRGARFAGAAPAPPPVLPAVGGAYEGVPPGAAGSGAERAAGAAGAGPAPGSGGAGRSGAEAGEAVPPPPRGARFPGSDAAGAGAPPAAGIPESAGGATPVPSVPPPRGARFAGAGAGGGRGGGGRRRKDAAEADRAAARRAAGRRLAGETAATVAALRDAGRTGEAYARLSTAAAGPPEALPDLVAELERTVGTAEVATLLWEAAALPPERLTGAADAFAAAGRTREALQLVRHAAARPVPELAAILSALHRAGRDRESEELLDAFAATRGSDEAVELAGADPGRLVPQLLRAARRGPAQRHRRLAHALRSAGLPGAPDSA